MTLLDSLTKLDLVFSAWFKLGSSRDDALAHAVVPSAEALRQLLSEGQSQADFGDDAIEELGFYVGLWTGGDDEKSASLSLNCGGYSRFVGNSCVINLPTDEKVAARILQTPKLGKILGCMVSSLEPDWGVVNPLAYLRVAEERQGKKSPLVGWITYLAASPDSISSLPLPARVTPMGKQGALIVITDERFTASNIAHVEAADNVALALDQAGLRE